MNDLMTKSFANYVDLKKAALKDLEAGPDFDNVEMSGNPQMDPNFSDFLAEAEKVKEEMSLIREILGTIQEAHEESKSLHKSDALKAVRHRINTDILNVLKKAKIIRSRIEDLDRATIANRRLSGYAAGTPLDRARTSVTNGLRQKLKVLMMEFQDLRQKIMSEHKDTVGRRYFTVTGEYPEEEVIEKIISNNGGEDFLQRAVQEHGKGKVLETVVEIKDRHEAAKEIEKSLLELHQVFLDMAVMVEAQGDQIDNIEHHVTNAAQYVKDGSKELHQAKGYQRSSRKCMCIGLVLLLILILVIVIPIITSFKSS
ncbi:hypothetical protein C5167_046563 [Papaver somniferum]|uniref:t-SNARE coiled-coil homology domain-containing protein n=1 Tax=Papaver somniferum TaxID=3469 RepID=A0A4Y7LHT6_PAPSO|nr:syntaxin-related protein KNOLLE-like [Papaver somniferum]XP_026427198.1 syntaxin-related protein KNOLLE-like [Papaver somniferum]RZC83769.1 hypothetical protein C5167_046556 [Papaver somniferum]RZC83779.1 hypothetical protein C5167_046563 [Papaver somniferum]